MGPFEVTKELVSGLDDTQLRKLLEHLLVAEANTRGIPHIAISVGGNQTAGDGGVDASISWTEAAEPADWLPRRLVYFQSKAEAMGPAKLRREMCPDDEPRPIFAELANAKGAYIVFSTDDPSKSAMDNRLEAMAAAVADVENANQILLDFYGADRIARWANLHLGVAIWLLGQDGRSLGGWRRYGDWSAAGATDQDYLIDETGRVALGETIMDAASAIDAIRTSLAVPGGVVRLVGLSGMGKTRMAEALFDKRVGADALPQDRAIYGDAGRDLETGAARVTEELLLAGAEAIVVVDNANARTHSQLAEIVGRQGSRLRALYEAEGGILPALQILHMRIFGDRQDKRAIDPALQALGRQFLADPRTFVEENENEDHGIATIAKAALTGDGANEAAAATCRALVGGTDAKRYHSRDFGTLCKLLIGSFPRVVLDEIIAKDTRESLLYQLFGGPFRDDDQADEEKFAFDLDAVLDWVREAPEDRASRLADIGPYFAKDDETGLLRWSGLALGLIAIAPNPSAILRTFEHRFFTGSSSGPFSARFVRRRPLVSAMLAHKDANIRNWARAASQRLEDSILRWDERDRDRESRFE